MPKDSSDKPGKMPKDGKAPRRPKPKAKNKAKAKATALPEGDSERPPKKTKR